MPGTKNTFRIAVRQFGPFESAMQKLWDHYCLETGCTVQAEMVPMDLHLLHQSILKENGLANGTWDVAHINTDWLCEAYASGALEDLKPYIDKNPPNNFPKGWSASLLSMQRFGSEIVGLPFHDGPECLIYRKDLFDDKHEQQKFFEQYGKPLQVPRTWEEFQIIARFFHRPEENLYGTAFAAYPDGHNTVFDFCLQLWTRGGNLTDKDGLVNIHSPQAAEGLEFYRNILQDKQAVHPNSPDYESVQAGAAFARGEAAMMINWFGFASVCEVSDGCPVKGKVDIAGLPKGDGGESASLNVYWLYSIGSGSRHKELAYDFIRFATNRKNDKLLTLEGGIGCRISTWNDEEVNRIVPYYHKLEMLHQNARSLPLKSNWAQIAAIIDEVVLKALNTGRPVNELLEEGQEKIRLIDFI